MGDKPTIPEVVARFAKYKESPRNSAWGSLHIVLDDNNTEDSSVQFCVNYARELGDGEGEQLAQILLRMSRTQRRKLPDAVYDFLNRPAERRGEQR